MASNRRQVSAQASGALKMTWNFRSPLTNAQVSMFTLAVIAVYSLCNCPARGNPPNRSWGFPLTHMIQFSSIGTPNPERPSCEFREVAFLLDVLFAVMISAAPLLVWVYLGSRKKRPHPIE